MNTWSKTAIVAGVVTVVPFVPIVVGFGTGGIVGGSIAAGMQSSVGCVAAGSAFAFFQSLGATGALAATAITGSVVTATTSTVAIIKGLRKKEVEKII